MIWITNVCTTVSSRRQSSRRLWPCGSVQHIKLIRKARKILYCGVQAAIFDFGADMILAEEIKPIEDEEIEFGYVKQYTINSDGETYVDLFRRHKEEEKET